MSASAKFLISIVDDDESVREALASLMTSLGFEVKKFASAADFLASPNIVHTSCMIADVHMPDMTGIELHRRLAELGYGIPTILITAYPDEGDRARAFADGVVCYLNKPSDDEVLLGCVQSALQGKPPGGHSRPNDTKGRS